MVTLAERYRGNAHEAQVMELETQDPFLRRSYAKVAHHWFELANSVKQQEAASAWASGETEPAEGIKPEEAGSSAHEERELLTNASA